MADCGGSAPAAPDYVGAANAQASASRELTDVQNYANRPQQYTPFGSTTWSSQSVEDPATGKPVTQWTQSTQLAPGLQAALDAQIGTQLGRSQLAGGFMNRVANEYAQPFDWSNMPQRASLPGTAQLNTGLADYTPGLQTGVNSRSGDVVSGFGFGGPQMGVGAMPVRMDFDSKNQALARQTGTEALQRGLATGDNPMLPQMESSYRDQVANQLFQRMLPLQERAQSQLETKLSNQGFKQGSEAYRRALDELNARQSAERYNALDQAGNEAQRLYNMQMGSRQQAFNEDVAGGNFYNQAANQAFQQGLGAAQFQNQATGQAFNQSMQAKQAQNAAAGQAFNQNLAAGNFGNQAQQQLYNQMLGQAQLNNSAQQQAFNQDLAATQFGNQALGQASALDIARMNAQNQAAQNQFGLNMQAAQFQNQLRQQAIAEEAQRRGMSLNEMNALLSGQQVAMPQMPSFTPAQRSETPNILGATQMGYDAQLGAYNAQQAQQANMMGGLFQLGSAAMMSPAASAFMFSDRRLKSNIRRVGTHPLGVGIYDYTMLGMKQRGVIAQEVQAVRPDLVERHASGYLMVNYGGL